MDLATLFYALTSFAIGLFIMIILASFIISGG